MTVTEITNVMDLFKKFTMKKFGRDGRIKAVECLIKVSELGVIERLVTAMRYINKVITPSFVRDWCLKCCRHLKSSADLFVGQRNNG